LQKGQIFLEEFALTEKQYHTFFLGGMIRVFYSSTWNFVLEAVPGTDDYIGDPDYPDEAYF
jgi:hypothetical protein